MANKARHGDGYYIAASPTFRSRACWLALTNKGTATAQNPPFLNAFRRIPPTAPALGVWSALECRVAGLGLQQLANPAVRGLQAFRFLAVVQGEAFGVDELDIGDADEAEDLAQVLCL